MFITCGMYMDPYYNLGLCVCVYKKSFFFFFFSLGSYIARGFEDFLNAITPWVYVLNCHFLLLCSFSCSCELR